MAVIGWGEDLHPRLGKDMSLAQLGWHSGMSAGMLSKIENGQIVPTLPTLMRIAMVFGVGLDHFFAQSQDPVVALVRAADRLRLPNPPDGTPAYWFESLDYPVTQRRLEAYYARFEHGAPAAEPHRHDGAELVYVIAGELELTIHGRTQRLEPGDSLYFEADFPHRYAGGQGGCEALVVVSVDP
ncbi:MAG: XRE family transcriptional regulator [Paracoccaceae bacterium]